MKRDLMKPVAGLLLGGIAMVVVSACGGATGGATPTPAPPKATAISSPKTASVPTAAPTKAPVPTPSAVPPATTAPAPKASGGAGDLAAKGKVIFEKTAGGVGCASCHGLDGKGTAAAGAPDIRGANETRVRGALAGLPMMSFIKLSDEEITAVVAYLQVLREPM